MMMNTKMRFWCVPILCFLMMSTGSADKKSKVTQVTVVIRGVHCSRDAQVLLKQLKKRAGIKTKIKKINAGKTPKFFSQPLSISLSLEKTDVGTLAELVSKVKTPHRKEFPPKLNLVLFTTEDINEPSVMRLRRVLRPINGLEVDAPGGLGGFPKRGYYWVQLENAGGAGIKEIQAALLKAKFKVTLARKKKK